MLVYLLHNIIILKYMHVGDSNQLLFVIIYKENGFYLYVAQAVIH